MDSVNGVENVDYLHTVELVVAETWTLRFALRFRAWDVLDVAAREGKALVVGSNDFGQFFKIGLNFGTTTLEPRPSSTRVRARTASM